MLQNYKYLSPFKILISFHIVIDVLEQQAVSEVDYQAARARALLSQIKDHPEFVTGIESIAVIQKNQEIIQQLLSELFPAALTHHEIKAVTLPFYDFTFNYSEKFKTLLSDVDGTFDLGIRDMEAHQFYIMNCTLILKAYYHQNIDFEKPLFYDIPDKNGLLTHYKIVYNADFMEILPSANTRILTAVDLEELIDNYDDIALWKKAFPENSWILKGFALITLIDATEESAVSELKTNLLKKNPEKSKLSDRFESIFRSVLKIPDLKIGLTFYDEEEARFVAPPFNEGKSKSFLLLDVAEADCKNVLCGCSFENLIHNQQPFLLPDVSKFATSGTHSSLTAHLLRQNIHSFLWVPMIKDAKLLGLFELASPTTRAINSFNANKLTLVLPFIFDTIEKTNDDMLNQLEAIIQKEYTAIHSSVYWKFKKEAKKYFYSKFSNQNFTFKAIVFKDVYPLYGQIDIKGSSDNRNNAIVTDLRAQIHQIIGIMELLHSTKKMGVLSQKIFELHRFLEELALPFQNNLEQTIHYYLETEIHSFLKKPLEDLKIKNKIADYFNKLDRKTGVYYQARKDFDDTIMSINKMLSTVLDDKQQQAQALFPHYYERFKTDGVEHNLYIGSSIAPTKMFDVTYLHNLRLWQLETLCEMELEHHKLKTTLPFLLDVTALLLAFSSPISIRFRLDEKRFDVDGSYNARYEVVKKRIDKAFVKNTTERITQKEKITIVYANVTEEKEYLKYIQYLQHKALLDPEIETLEIEDLQGISGLKALRVKVTHPNTTLVAEAAAYITSLFENRLDSNYSYHNLEHTKNVVRGIATLCQAEKIAPPTTDVLLLAGWFHDAGYVEGEANHEEKSVAFATAFLLDKTISTADLQTICDLILATTCTHIPQNAAEKIIKDADHAHLAQDNYPDTLVQLRNEWGTTRDQYYTDEDWYLMNRTFLKKHHYHTTFAQKNWQVLKEAHLKVIETHLQNTSTNGRT